MSTEDRPRRLSRAETRARTRGALLDAAAQVFARKGFSGASVDDIAEAAGFTTGALYSNFAGKEALFVQLLADRSSNRLDQAVTVVSNGVQDLDHLRSALNDLLIRVADQDGDLAPLQAEIWLYAIRRPEVLQDLADQFRENRTALSTVLTHWAAQRDREKHQDPEQVATVLLALFTGLVQLRRTDAALVPEDLYGSAASWIFTGLAHQPHEP